MSAHRCLNMRLLKFAAKARQEKSSNHRLLGETMGQEPVAQLYAALPSV